MKCPLCEDTGKVRLSKPMTYVIETTGPEDVEFDLLKNHPCPACAAGLRRGILIREYIRRETGV